MLSTIAVGIIAAIGFGPLMNQIKSHQSLETEEEEMVQAIGPEVNADSIFSFIQTQCDFGPRTMNSPAHDKCGEWIAQKMKDYGCEVTNQYADLKAYDGTILKSRNIIAQHNPQAKKRILLCAHWDTRPWADNDADSTNWKKPIDGANDGASGVAVIIEIARLLAQDTTINIGVDFVFFDAEDWGTPQWSDSNDGENTWALGSQHFAKNLPANFQPQFGILLDIVGGQGAKFYREGISMQFAPQIVKKVWRAARKAGYGSYFPDQDGGMVTDDHLPLNQIAGIPTIDIIAYYPDCQQSSFGHTWHTLNDNINFIDKNTLKAVGQTVMQVIAEE